MKKYVFVLDCDGVITDGGMWYNKDGKYLKKFGGDDFDLIKECNKLIRVNFITADKRGYPIMKKRLEDEMGLELNVVSHIPSERWKFIKEKYKDDGYFVIFMGDGWGDVTALKNSDYGITVMNALSKVRQSADYVVPRKGADRAVAEACLHIFERFDLGWAWEQ